MGDRYAVDPLAGGRAPRPALSRPAEATPGLVVEEVTTGWCGAVVRVETVGGQRVVHLEDRHGRSRGFPLGPGFLLDGAPVELVPPRPAAALPRVGTARTASGSRAVAGHSARVARGSRLFVEGIHDAELVERVWGDDLRVEGVVVEPLGGIDDLAALVEEFRPTGERRLGVLVDHLVPGSKETTLVETVRADRRWRGSLKILGHPYVDVWQAVRPHRLGLSTWPAVPVGVPWKQGVLEHLGWPAASQADVAAGWRRILGAVRDYTDLEPSLLAPVEELIDFVTVGIDR